MSYCHCQRSRGSAGWSLCRLVTEYCSRDDSTRLIPKFNVSVTLLGKNTVEAKETLCYDEVTIINYTLKLTLRNCIRVYTALREIIDTYTVASFSSKGQMA